MKYGNVNNRFRVLTLFAIGFLSVAFYLLKNPISQISIPQGEITATKYGIGLHGFSGEFFLLGSPLNDFYYRGFSKNYLFDEILENKNGGLLKEFSIEMEGLFLNQQSLELTFKGKNHDGEGSINYEVRYFSNRVEIKRNIILSKNFDGVGQAIVICSGCFVTDDKKRIYLNPGFLATIDFAAKMNLTPVVLGENQFFPAGISEVIILNKNGQVKIRIPINLNEQISLQENLNILEFRIPIKGISEIKQIIYL